jgi:predicted small secreted protein
MASNPPLPRSFGSYTGGCFMFRKIVTMALIGGSLAIAACNTVRGAGEDVKSAANCTENAINGSTRC